MESNNAKPSLSRGAYTVGWVTVINPEFVAAIAMLDEEHERPLIADDPNFYVPGCVKGHNVIIARSGEAGPTPAANCAAQMMRSFPNIRIGLLAGIGGGVPSSKNDIRLGDVVVSRPGNSYGGVALYDTAKMKDDAYELTGHLNRPPLVLTNAVNYLEAMKDFGNDDLCTHLNTIRLKDFSSADGLTDILYDAADQTKTVNRHERVSKSPIVHYGLIASGSWLIKASGSKRDDLLEKIRGDVLCFEMEAAGLMNNFPCLVIRGISDYCDSHKNDDWHKYAAAAAACYCKWLLGVIRPDELRSTEIAANIANRPEHYREDERLQGTQNNYTIAWICAYSEEMACASAMLDEEHDLIPQQRWDDNLYKFGRIGNHNIVIACLPSSRTGISLVANMATKLMISFPSLRFSLSIGTASGIPTEWRDIRLGDVIVSKGLEHGDAVVQFDAGKIRREEFFVEPKQLGGPSNLVLGAVSALKAKNMAEDHKIEDNINKMFANKPKMKDLFSRPDTAEDYLFDATYHCVSTSGFCQNCDPSMQIARPPRKNNLPVIHYGIVASGSAYVRDSHTRDRIQRDLGAIAIDIEAAGLMEILPCLVVRGVYNYADSHVTRGWRYYATAVAAAYAKELLSHLSTEQVKRENTSNGR